MRMHLFTALLTVPALAWASVAAAQDTTRSRQDTTRSTQTQDSVTLRSSDEQMGTLSDNMVLMKMHRTNQMEIRVGRLAQSHGSSAKVKSFGARLVRDHSASDQKVVALAKKLGITLARADGMDSTDHYGMRKGEYRGRDTTSAMQRSDSMGREGYRRGDSTYSSQRYDSTGQQGRGQMREHADLQQLSTLRGAAFDSTFANAMVEGHNKAIGMLEQAQGQVQHDELRSLIASTLPTLRQHLQTAQSLSTSTGTTSSR